MQVGALQETASGAGEDQAREPGDALDASLTLLYLHPGKRLGKQRTIFLETTPLGYRVRLTRDRWRQIIRFKHPALAGYEKEARDCVRDPELIRESQKDSSTHLFYRHIESGYICVVVCGEGVNERFVVTAYFTASLKKGTDLWKK